MTQMNQPKSQSLARETWAPDFPRVVFVVGGGSTAGDEAAQFNDLLLLDFADAYGNLTLKTSAALLWAAKSCPRLSFALRLDSDWLPNP